MLKVLRFLKSSKWLVFALIFVMFTLVAWKNLDPDFGWHLASGQYFIAHGVPTHDVFTYTATSFPWVDHEWLSDIFLSLVYGLGGYNLLAVVYGGLWTLAFWLIGRRANSWIVLAAVLAALPFAGVRAVVWSMLGLAGLLTLIKIWSNKKRRGLIIAGGGLVGLIWLWANVHGGFVIGVAVLLFYAFIGKDWRLAVVAGLGGLAALLNPYGIGIYVEVWRTLFDPALHNNILEWRPFWWTMEWSLGVLLVLYGAGYAWSVMNGKRRNWRTFVTAENVFLLASLGASRNWPLFALAAIPATDQSWRRIIRTLPKKIPKFIKRLTIAIVVVLTAFGGYSLYGQFRGSWQREASYPQAAVEYLAKKPCSGNLFNHYNIGGYLIWKLPSHKVYIDGRMPSWVAPDGEKYFDQHKKVLDDKKAREKEFQKYNITCVLTGEGSDMVKDLKKDGWREIAKGPSSSWVLLARQ
jgi:hypothetical protein